MSDFLIGDSSDSNPASWSNVGTLLSDVSDDITAARALEWEHQDYSKCKDLANGHVRGLGLPIVKWTFKALRPEQRENLRDFCSGMSAEVYIQTPTNETTDGERVWKNYFSIMKWMQRSELVGAEWVEEIELTFTHCLVVTE